MLSYQPLQTSSSPAYQHVAAARQPFYITFREHYCFSPSVPVPLYDDEVAFDNGLLPQGCRFVQVEVHLELIFHFASPMLLTTGLQFLLQGGVNITNETRSFNAFYETYRPEPEDLINGGHVSSRSRPIDIIITGEVCPFTLHCETYSQLYDRRVMSVGRLGVLINISGV